VLAAGAVPLRPRRLQRDALFDADDGTLKQRGCALRVRTDGDLTILTFKGTPQPGLMKTREEHETAVADPIALAHLLEGLGFQVWFRYEKFREEFVAPDVVIAVDETPVGTYVEIEGEEHAIIATASALGRTEADFIRQSYRALFIAASAAGEIVGPDMIFPAP
jgi:adenylate cyclase class 2